MLVGLPLLLAIVLAMSGQSLPLPRPVLDLAQAQMNFALRRAGTVGAQATVGGVSIALDRRFRPRIHITDIRLADRDGHPVLELPAARLTFRLPSVSEPVQPLAVVLEGARINVQRRADGSFDLALGVKADDTPIQSYPEAIEEIRRALTVPLASTLRYIHVADVTALIEDARAGRTWTLNQGDLTLRRPAGELEAELSARVEGSDAGQLGMTFHIDLDQGTTRMEAQIASIPARDIAAQAAPLAALAVLDADVSGSLSAAVDGSGSLSQLSATLDLGQGALLPREDMQPVTFDAASMGLSFDPAANKVSLSDLEVTGPTLRISADGHAYLRDLQDGLPDTILTQLRFRDLSVDPEGLFTEPVRFTSGTLDARLRLDPFTMELGQVALVEGDRVLRGHGRVSAEPDGWHLSFDPSLNRIRRDQLLALWPVDLVPRTREWLDDNVLEGDLRRVRAAIRIAPGQTPRVSLSYAFQGGDVRFLRTLPPIEKGEGYASIHEDRYAMKLHRGQVTPPEGGPVTADGSSLVVPDLRDTPIHVKIALETDSSVTAALSLLDQPPFRFLSRAGRSPDIGTGHARVTALLDVPLVDDLKADAVGFDVRGKITDFSSDTLVEGRQLTAPILDLTAVPEGLAVSGSGTLGRLPFTATYRLPLAGGAAPSVEGEAMLSQAALEEFRIGLPDGLIAGQAPGRFRVDLPKDAPPDLHLTSNLVGMRGRLEAIGWTKPASEAGRLEVHATLGPVPQVRRLALKGGGLDAAGSVDLRDGGLEAARLSRVRLNGWLDAPVTLTARGPGQAPAVRVNGGRVDLRRLNLGGGGAGRGGDDTPIDAQLDEVRVTDALALTDMQGRFTTAGGFRGDFKGRVNGGAALAGRLDPARHGTSVRLVSQDAGGALRDAGIFGKVQGGSLDLQLVPRPAKGEYDGIAVASGLRVMDLPAAAGLVNALSVVGLADQLANGGILFESAHAAFRLTPGAIEVTRGAATGPSLGVSAAGVYRMTDTRFFMQGVVTPIYFLNGAGSTDGKGLFGMTWRLRGTPEAPQISVNPLSLVTPGPLRDALQGPAPRLAQ